MADFKAAKTVAALPAVLEPDTIYLVRKGEGFDLWATNGVGTIKAFPLNQEGGGGGGGIEIGEWIDVPMSGAFKIPFDYKFMYRTYGDSVQIVGTAQASAAVTAGTIVALMPVEVRPTEGVVGRSGPFKVDHTGELISLEAFGLDDFAYCGMLSYPLQMPPPVPAPIDPYTIIMERSKTNASWFGLGSSWGIPSEPFKMWDLGGVSRRLTRLEFTPSGTSLSAYWGWSSIAGYPMVEKIIDGVSLGVKRIDSSNTGLPQELADTLRFKYENGIPITVEIKDP